MRKIRKTLLAAVLVLGASIAAYAGPGNLYVASNATSGNQIAVLKRDHDGHLTVSGTYATGGLGSGVGLVIPPDPLGSQNSLWLSKYHNWLYAVNAGSNQISVFKVQDDKLSLLEVVPSGGRFPVNFTTKGNLLYVLNAAGGGNVTGFRVGYDGKLKPIPGSTRLLHVNTPDVGSQPDVLRSPTQALFSPDGDWLVVTTKNFDAVGTIQRFAVNDDGLLSETPLVTPSQDRLTFGFLFDRRGHLLVTEGVHGLVASYRLEENGALDPIGRSAPNGQLATCWIDATKKFVYVSNTLRDNLTGYRLERDGQLNILDANGVSFSVGQGYGPIDLKVSPDERFLNLVNSGSGTVSTFRIDPLDGHLTQVSDIPVFPPLSGMQGLATE